MSDHDLRLDLIRQYMLDVEDNPASCLEVQGAVDYVRWNFQAVLEDALYGNDLIRRLRRDYADPSDSHEFMEIRSPIADIKIGTIHKVCGTRGAFVLWFHRNILSPILSEENRILEHCESPLIVSSGDVRGYVDRNANSFRFSAWEVVRFPSARAVPDAREPSPEENSQRTL